MEAAENFARQNQPTPEVGVAMHETEARIIPFPSRRGRGFLSQEGMLPYEIEIADWKQLKERWTPGVGAVQTSLVQLEDGSQYVFRKTIPQDVSWETSVDFALPLATRVKGYNTYLARKLAESGMQTRILGTNQAHGFSLLHDAQAALHILSNDDTENTTAIPNESLLFGYSMGTMKGLGIQALSPLVGRDIKSMIGLDPCLAEKVDYSRQLEELPALMSYLGREILEVTTTLGKSIRANELLPTINRARHFVSTMGISPAYITNVYDKWKVLASGETGNFPAHVPTDAAIVLHFFKACRFNDAEQFKRLFPTDAYPNVRIVEEDGYHLSGADSRVVKRIVNKVNLAQHMLAEGVPANEIADQLASPVLTD